MVLNILLLIWTSLNASGFSERDKVYTEAYLGEKQLRNYFERYTPEVEFDIYQGKKQSRDDVFFQNYFQAYLFQDEKKYNDFFKLELLTGQQCSNETLTEHLPDIRYSYRLITLSYLFESIWHLNLISSQFNFKKICRFEPKKFLNNCRPKTTQMKKFLERLKVSRLNYDEKISSTYSQDDWWREFKEGKFKWYSHYRVNSECHEKCLKSEFPRYLDQACKEDESLMNMICSENDEIYGLSFQRDAYDLLGQSNIVNSFNKKGEALGCLRRFSEIFAHKEVKFKSLKLLFPPLKEFLKEQYKERFLQGRLFFYGSGKEFEDKGLSDYFVKDQKNKLQNQDILPEKTVTQSKPKKKNEVIAKRVVPGPVKRLDPPTENFELSKSSFLMAAEVRSLQDLDLVEIDMLKLKYDYVFSLNMINTLSLRLKNYMTRDALIEMKQYDMLGSKEAPVPLLFIKFMIDMQEHQGLWNLISILGDKFYVSNEIDSKFNPSPELIQLSFNQSIIGSWQIYVLKP